MKKKNYLILDSTSENSIWLGIFNGQAFTKEYSVRVSHTEAKSPLIPIASFLQRIGKKPEHFSGILVREGAGRFSALRASASVGISIAYVYGLPLATVADRESSTVREALPHLKKRHTLSPRYGAEPNITVKKQA